MPLLDHFHPPLSRSHPWRAFHGAWAAAIARGLNAGVLPAGYYAVPFLDRDGPVEIDVATIRESAFANGGTAFWAPPEPEWAVAVEWPLEDEIRVEILTDNGDPQIAAAIEIVSPSNKDRPQSREAFAAKCAEYLCRGCGLVVIDAVSTRRADLAADLRAALEVDETSESNATTTATSYRAVGRNGDGRLFAWPASLEIGRVLPTVPLWLGGELSVPLDLETSYNACCTDLRIR